MTTLSTIATADPITFTSILDQLKQVYIIGLILSGIVMVFLFITGKIGKALTILAIDLLSMIPTGLAAAGVAAVWAFCLAIVHLFTSV